VSGADDWRPTARLDVLAARARVLAAIRGFFAEAGVLEVETPALSFAGSTDPALASLSTRYTGPGAPLGATLWLQTSPEFAMKRLLAAGSGPIWQLCRVFRDGERGRRHNPEFSLLEWYRPGFSMHDLIDEVVALLRCVLGGNPFQAFGGRNDQCLDDTQRNSGCRPDIGRNRRERRVDPSQPLDIHSQTIEEYAR